MVTLRLALFLLISVVILAMPSNPVELGELSAIHIPLEAVGLVLAAAMMTGRVFAGLRWAATFFLALLLLLKVVDLGTGIAFQRPFNPYLDARLPGDGWNLLRGSTGSLKAAALVCAGLLAWISIIVLLYWTMGGFRQLSATALRKVALASAVALLLGIFLAAQDELGPRVVRAELMSQIDNRLAMVRQSIDDLAGFEKELDSDPVQPDPTFSALADRDVILIFIESYGRSAVEDPPYAPSILKRLASIEGEIQAAGLQARSGWLTSPTVGGLSWLAHGTLLSGLWIDNQARYDRLVTSGRRSLNSLFRAAGWHTAAVMPAITMEWPEASYFGYSRVHAAAGLGYKGIPFNWATMPDQYTLSAFERLERQPGGKPVMAEIALISSHAPWSPVPRLIGWDEIGDGSVFNPQALAGDPPSVIWSDPDRVRQQYLAALDYTLQTLGSYMARFGRDTLFILVGDHQPASIITGEGASRDVPVHVVSGDPTVLDRIRGWGWQRGMTPAEASPVYRMDAFRRMFVESFDEPAVHVSAPR